MIENELVQAIQQISEELSQTSGWDIAGVIIGGIGIILTIVVLWYNHRSIELTQHSIRQAIDLQLFEKRLELYNGIAQDKAFAEAPLSLKIAYTEHIYQLYVEIVESRQKCWEAIHTFFLVFRHENLREDKNSFKNIYQRFLEETSKLLSSNTLDKKSLDGLKKIKIQADENYKEMLRKYEILETEMKLVLKQSLKV